MITGWLSHWFILSPQQIKQVKSERDPCSTKHAPYGLAGARYRNDVEKVESFATQSVVTEPSSETEFDINDIIRQSVRWGSGAEDVS
jgi:hypothetical protein